MTLEEWAKKVREELVWHITYPTKNGGQSTPNQHVLELCDAYDKISDKRSQIPSQDIHPAKDFVEEKFTHQVEKLEASDTDWKVTCDKNTVFYVGMINPPPLPGEMITTTITRSWAIKR